MRRERALEALKEDGPVLTSGKTDFWHQEFRLRKDGKGAWGVLLVEGGAKSDKELADSVLIGLRMSDSNKTALIARQEETGSSVYGPGQAVPGRTTGAQFSSPLGANAVPRAPATSAKAAGGAAGN